jgi:DNA replication and repair protein RecF
MPLTLLEVENLRVFEKFRLAPDLRLNLIIGPNASGKTSLLEAIHLLGTGRSFRSTHLNQLIRQSAPSFLVSGLFHDVGIPAIRLALQRDPQHSRFSVGGSPQASASSLARTLPLQIISPDSHFQFFSSSRHRRGILDWGVFHVEPDFYPQWLRYQRALNQRNASLKARQPPKACFAWDPELTESGERLHGYRHQFLEAWNIRFQHYCLELLGTSETEIGFRQGWDPATGFTEALLKERGRDAQTGTTHSGPHRADLSLSFSGQTTRVSASHGQQKLLVIALRLAQMEIFTQRTTRHCVVLLDDLAAELDPLHRQQLMRTLSGMSLQVFVTATEPGLVETQGWITHKVFHVERGLLEESP